MNCFLAVTFALFAVSSCDIYLHNPRGSNNRLDEQGRERNNANRLFDSQNNNRGGYNAGGLYYYAGSKLSIEWTNQHSCMSPNAHCEIIIQYMCTDNLRDGATTTTIPENPGQCDDYDCNTDTEYGMHENYEYYLNCRKRSRNMGLYLASQNLGGKNKQFARNTRQNPNGNRRGYECPEERDYYPYWHPTLWKDIAVLTNNAERCGNYTSESENVKSRWHCVLPRSLIVSQRNNNNFVIPNNKEACDAFRWPENNPNGTRAVWTESKANGHPAPVCHETSPSRDNHLGNGVGGYPNVFNWTVPEDFNERCALRVRYNISTADYDGSTTDAEQNGNPSDIGLAVEYDFANTQEANGRGYQFKNNPQVQIFAGLPMQLAINTAQYGRTFQDRSHVFAIRERPASLEGQTIHNLNVRGKRGNIVQVYPAVEYDFVPNTLKMTSGDFVHFQWTGANTNPNNNDGQGRQGTDRSNVVLQNAQVYQEGSGAAYNLSTKYGHWGSSYPMFIKDSDFLGFTGKDLQSLALMTPNHFGGEMSELDDAGTYFDLGPRKVTQAGSYHYMCTRNNNFSNRSQKGRIICQDQAIQTQAIGWNGGGLSVGRTSVSVEEGEFSGLHVVSVEEWDVEQMEERTQMQNDAFQLGDGYASPFILLQPMGRLTADGKTFQMEIDIDSAGTDDITIYHASSDTLTWTAVSADISGGRASFAAQEGGYYVAARHSNVGMIVGAVIATLVIVGVIVGGTLFYSKRNPELFSNITRSFQQKV